MKFGAFLKSLRIESGISLRQLAQKSGYDVAYLSRLERDLIQAPQNDDFFEKIEKSLSLQAESSRKLHDFASIDNGGFPRDISFSEKDYEFIPILLRTISNKKLSDDQYRELTKMVNTI